MQDRLRNIADELWNQVVNKTNSVAWIGSGLSRGAGYPSWSGLVDELCEKCSVTPLGELEKKSARRLIEKAEDCKWDERGEIRKEYRKVLETFYLEPLYDTPDTYNILASLPFDTFVTTNFDSLLFKACQNHGHELRSRYPHITTTLQDKSRKPFDYIHGLADPKKPASIDRLVLSTRDFYCAYTKGKLDSFVSNIFYDCPVLFICCGLEEPAMEEVFKYLSEKQQDVEVELEGNPGKKHYALLPKGLKTEDEEKIEDEKFLKKGIFVKRYKADSSERHHAELLDILKYFSERNGRPLDMMPAGLVEERPTTDGPK